MSEGFPNMHGVCIELINGNGMLYDQFSLFSSKSVRNGCGCADDWCDGDLVDSD